MFKSWMDRLAPPEPYKVETKEDWLKKLEDKPKPRRSYNTSSRYKRSEMTHQEVLNILARFEGKPISRREIAVAIGKSMATVSGAIKALEESGAIKRGKTYSGVLTYRVKRMKAKRRAPSTKVRPEPPKIDLYPEKKHRNYIEGYDKHKQKFLDFVKRYEDRQMTYVDISRITGIPIGSLSNVVAILEREKKIVRSYEPRIGTRFWLYESLQNGPEIKPSKEKVERLEAASTDENLHSMITTLVWQYMEEQKQTDILWFLEWLKQRK